VIKGYFDSIDQQKLVVLVEELISETMKNSETLMLRLKEEMSTARSLPRQ
jgi:hypothetical protein